MDGIGAARLLDRHVDSLQQLLRVPVAPGGCRFIHADLQFVSFDNVDGYIASHAVHNDVRAGGNVLGRKLLALRSGLMEGRNFDVQVGIVTAKPVAEDKPGQHERQENRQGYFSTGEKRRANLSGLARRQVFDQLRHSPEDDQNRPVDSNQVAESELGIEAIDEEDYSEQD
jgi:hypothetical protein